MALEHALLVSLSERPGTGIELTRRFDRSIGFFWRATHQQIYKVLRRMEDDGWLEATAGDSRSTERRYAVTDAGRAALETWIAMPTRTAAMRSEVAVKMRGASYGDRTALLDHLRHLIGEHRTRQAHFERLEREQFPRPAELAGQRLDTWLVLRGGIKQEQFWVEWLSEYVEAWVGSETLAGARSSTSETEGEA
ncbi:MAG: PadR family transcriptional regulator [Marmoricola sp.]|jgi:DNA-binding PadR family transcriptional regulator|nr:PadR family transcriptional regulator [Marmoricola sp.]